MTTFVKYIDSENVELAQRVIHTERFRIANPRVDTLFEYGYKPLIVDERPQNGDNHTMVPYYEDAGDKIIQHWNIM